MEKCNGNGTTFTQMKEMANRITGDIYSLMLAVDALDLREATVRKMVDPEVVDVLLDVSMALANAHGLRQSWKWAVKGLAKNLRPFDFLMILCDLRGHRAAAAEAAHVKTAAEQTAEQPTPEPTAF